TREVAQLETTAEYTNPAGNLSWVVLSQRINGVPVFQGKMVAVLKPTGELIRTISNLASGLEIEGKPPSINLGKVGSTPKISASEAVARVAASIGVTIDPANLILLQKSPDGTMFLFHRGPFANDIRVEPVYFPVKTGTLILAWSVVLWQDVPA